MKGVAANLAAVEELVSRSLEILCAIEYRDELRYRVDAITTDERDSLAMAILGVCRDAVLPLEIYRNGRMVDSAKYYALKGGK